MNPIKIRIKVPLKPRTDNEAPKDKRDADDEDYKEDGSGALADDDVISDDDIAHEKKLVSSRPPTKKKTSPKVTANMTVPDQYQGVTNLSIYEQKLLDKLAKATRVVLKRTKVQAKEDPLLAKQAEEEKKRKARQMLEQQHVTLKRPRINPSLSTSGMDGVPGTGDASGVKLAGGSSSSFGGGAAGGGSASGVRTSSNNVDAGKSISELSSEYDEKGVIMLSEWYTKENRDPLILELPRLKPDAAAIARSDPRGKSGNTVVIWGTMPMSSERFAINIAPTPDYNEKNPSTTFLYHFNPRDAWEKRQVLQNTFHDGKWSRPDRSIFGMPITKGKRFELRITVNANKFVVFLDGTHIATFQNQCDPRFLLEDSSLYLIVPLIENHFGDKEDVRIHGVWWGIKEVGRLLELPPPSSPKSHHHRPKFNRHHYRGGRGGGHHNKQDDNKVLFVQGLPHDTLAASNEMLRLFEHYGIEKDSRGAPRIHVTEGKWFGYVALNTEKDANDAIQYLNGKPGQAGRALTVVKARPNSRRFFNH